MNILEITIILLRYNNMGVVSLEIISKLNLNKKENKFYYFMVFIFFCVGIALGTYIVKYMSAREATDLTSYFSTFTESIAKEAVNNKVLLFNILKKNLMLITIIIALSFTVFGTPIILLLDLVKGFTLGYTFSFLISTFDGKGLWLALASTIPQNIIYIPCFIALSIVGIEFSSTKLKDKFFNKGKVNTIVERELILKIGVLACVFIIGTLIEAYLGPNIIKFVVTNVYKVG
ncbi:stage II sporulation protein M [uncultured Clostridium sp.]|nr:stage II sporulation protein M [uncultured Clostridium sp.]